MARPGNDPHRSLPGRAISVYSLHMANRSGEQQQLTPARVRLLSTQLGKQMVEAFDRAPDVASAVVTIGAQFARSLAESGYRDTGPVTAAAALVAGDNPEVRAACTEAYTNWLNGLAWCLQRKGVPAGESAALAEVLLSGIQGALLLARVRQDTAPIHQVTATLGALAATAVV